jgi:hypothetical protein
VVDQQGRSPSRLYPDGQWHDVTPLPDKLHRNEDIVTAVVTAQREPVTDIYILAHNPRIHEISILIIKDCENFMEDTIWHVWHLTVCSI